MTPILEDVPVLKYILPDPIDVVNDDVKYPYDSMEEAILDITKLKNEKLMYFRVSLDACNFLNKF